MQDRTDTAPDEETRVVSEPAQPTSLPSIEIGDLLAERYRVVDRIGEGAMGSVVRAHDLRLRRDVALKQLRLEAIDASSRERMVREAHAMAQLSHPNVVSIYDVVETDLGMLIVMELVEGETLREWVDEERPWSAVVRAYSAAGKGLMAAHRVGIIHRDFKPSNVLIGRDDGQVKVADFGLAKLAGDDELYTSALSAGSEDSLGSSGSGPLTEAGVVMGTPRYMAPEQHRGHSLTPAADQYALCLALWEALHGAPPFASHKEKYDGPPSWTRDGVPSTVVRALERGLCASPEDRWPDVEALLTQLQPPDRASWKAGAVALIGTGALVSIGALVQSSDDEPCTAAASLVGEVWSDARKQSVREAILTAAPGYGEEVAGRVETELDAFADAWTRAHTDTCEATHVRNEQSAEVLDLRMTCLRRARGDLDALTGVLEEADETTAKRAHELLGGLPHLERCANVEVLRAEVPPPQSPEEAAFVDDAMQRVTRANALTLAGKIDEAKATLEPLPTDVTQLDYGPLRAHVLCARGEVLERSDHPEESMQMQREALGHALEHGQWTLAMKVSLRLSIVAGKYLSNPKQAAAYFDLALGMARRPGTPREVLPWVYNGYAGVLDRLGEHDAAREQHEKALEIRLDLYGPDDWRTALSYAGLATVHYRKREFEKSTERYEQALKIQAEQLGPDHPLAATSRSNLAAILLMSGKAAEAEPFARDTYEQHRRVHGDAATATFQAANTLAAAYSVQGKYDEAYAFLSKLIATAKEADLYDARHVLYARDNFAIVLSELGRSDEAIQEARTLLAFHSEHQGDEHKETSRSRYLLGDLLRKAGQFDEALTHLQRAVEIELAVHGPEHPDRVSALIALGQTDTALGKHDEALARLREAWSLIDEHALSLDIRGECAFALAQLLILDPATRKEGLAFGVTARDAIAEDVGADAPRHAEITAWLAKHQAT